MSSTPPQTPPPAPAAPSAPPAKKGTSPLVWVAVGCGGLLLVVVIVIIAGGAFLFHKGKTYMKEAEKNPAMAAAKLMVNLNPDLELVSTDEAKGTITVRNKKTGETMTVDLADAKKGRFGFKNEKGEEMTIETQGGKGGGGVRLHSKEGTMTFGVGSKAEAPAWVPTYPGSAPKGVYSGKGATGATGALQFETEDPPQKVLSYFEDQLKADGFTVSTNSYKQSGAMTGGLVSASNDAANRSVNVTVSVEEGKTQVMVNYTEEAGKN
jgi:hypothetical protein